MLTPETTQSVVMFLISVGSLAASELKERWALRRKQQTSPVDLSKSDQIETQIKPILEDLLAAKSDIEVTRTLDLIKRKRKLIYNAQREKLIAEEEYDKGKITSNMLQLQIEDCNTRIRNKLIEIEADLKSLGLYIEKQPSS